MLTHLQIRQFALIDRLDVELGPGLNVLTGETGAGKSIIIDALGLALGGRASREMVREGAETASVQAAFSLNPASPALMEILQELGLQDGFDPREEELIIRRDLSLQGPNRCWINGRLVTVAQLQRLAAALVEVHGQLDQQTLLQSREQLRLLDQFGAAEIGPALAAYQDAYRRWKEAQQALEAVQMDEGERARRIDLLRYQINEIDGVAPAAGEDKALQEERQVLLHAGKLLEAVEGAYGLLYAGDGRRAAADGVAEAVSLLERAAATDPRLGELLAPLQEALVALQDSAPRLRRYIEGLDVEPQRLEQVESRLAALEGLKRKYGPSLEEVQAFRAQAAAQLEELEGAADRRAALEQALEEAESALFQAASRLSALRQRWARRLEEAVGRELQGLGLGEPRLVVHLTQPVPAAAEGLWREGTGLLPQPFGADRVELLFSGNRGESPKPLAKVASGGELSRIMLAIKTVLAQVDEVPTLIFDEVDAGIGGETAQAVGARLSSLASHRQVLCITHLPQIAARAHRHFVVRKDMSGSRTRVTVERVEGDERVRELARMLGASREASSLQHARNLLARLAPSWCARENAGGTEGRSG